MHGPILELDRGKQLLPAELDVVLAAAARKRGMENDVVVDAGLVERLLNLPASMRAPAVPGAGLTPRYQARD